MNLTTLNLEIASSFAKLALAHATREYPNKLDHVLNGPEDLKSPRALHPIFYGSYDWHSNVHAYWLLATLYRSSAELPQRFVIADLFDRQITPANVSGEMAYLAQPSRGTFERPYGWAWLLMLAAELMRHQTDEGRRWSTCLEPLAKAFALRFCEFVPKATYPIRTGTHLNTAFAIALALEYAVDAHDKSLTDVLCAAAMRWYEHDADCQVWEPSAEDFLSPALVEAECMRRVLPNDRWRQWFDRFLPAVDQRKPPTLFEPVFVSDRADSRIAHLDGLNLSRAWCWRGLASGWDLNDSRRMLALETAEAHLAASLSHLADDYAGEHWLATFALLALSGVRGWAPGAGR